MYHLFNYAQGTHDIVSVDTTLLNNSVIITCRYSDKKIVGSVGCFLVVFHHDSNRSRPLYLAAHKLNQNDSEVQTQFSIKGYVYIKHMHIYELRKKQLPERFPAISKIFSNPESHLVHNTNISKYSNNIKFY